MINIKFLDNYFKLLFLSFWPIIWYELIFVYDPFIKFILVSLYSIITLVYILFMIFLKNNNLKSICKYYRISTLCAFIFTLFSLLLFPTSLLLLILKVIFIFIYLYFSYTKLFKYKIEEGLVGIIASLLLLVIMFLY